MIHCSSSPIKHPNLLQRTEIVALFNTFNRLSESVESITKFRDLYIQQHGRHWMTGAFPIPSELQQHPVTEESTMTDTAVLDEEAASSPGIPAIQPFFSSVLGEFPGCRLDPTAQPPHSTRLFPANIKTVLRGAQEWVLAKRDVVCDLILDLCHHPVLLSYGVQTRSRVWNAKP